MAHKCDKCLCNSCAIDLDECEARPQTDNCLNGACKPITTCEDYEYDGTDLSYLDK